MNKKTTVKVNKNAVGAIEKTGITSKVLLMENYPTKPRSVSAQTVCYGHQAVPVGANHVPPLPGSKDYETYKDNHKYKHDPINRFLSSRTTTPA